MSDHRLHITFICTGNICRSPMAEKMFAHQIQECALDQQVRVTSAGIGGWHVGDEADYRTRTVLQNHGLAPGHSATKVNSDHLNADLVIALDRSHAATLDQLGVAQSRLRLLRSFDTTIEVSDSQQLDVPDPYYGDLDDFDAVYRLIQAALPGVHSWVQNTLSRRE
ncbi:MAG: low molecular weight protein-tyrosine-phosphatase [Mycobacteriaceae bacterium]